MGPRPFLRRLGPDWGRVDPQVDDSRFDVAGSIGRKNLTLTHSRLPAHVGSPRLLASRWHPQGGRALWVLGRPTLAESLSISGPKLVVRPTSYRAGTAGTNRLYFKITDRVETSRIMPAPGFAGIYFRAIPELMLTVSVLFQN